ncbi:AAA family ATPase [Nocardia goodfellowii]
MGGPKQRHCDHIIRDAELAQVLERIGSKPTGVTLIDIVGDPGSGKTYLLGAVQRAAERKGVPTLVAHCAEADPHTPFLPVINALGARAQLSSNAVEVLTRLSAPVGAGPVLDGRLLSAIRRLLGEAPGRGAMIVLDDFHLADDGSIELIGLLLRCATPTPLTVILARRPRPIPPRAQAFLVNSPDSEAAFRIVLESLPITRAAELLELGPEDPVLADLYRRAGGNPLYLRTLCELATEPGLDLADTAFGTRVLSEIVTLDPAQSAVLEAVAVVGEPCDVDTLTAVTRLDRSQVCAATTALLGRDLVRRCSAHQDRLTIRHCLVGALVLAQADPCRRARTHRRTADLLEKRGAPPIARAPHLVSIGASTARDLDVLIAAAREAMPAAPQSAVHWLTAVLRRTEEPMLPGRVDVLVALTRASFAAGAIDQARGLVRELQTWVPAATVDAIEFCAVVTASFGGYAEALEILRTALGTGDFRSPTETLALLLAKGTAQFLTGDLPSCDDLAELRRLAEVAGDPAQCAMVSALCGLREVWHRATTQSSVTLARCAWIVDSTPDSAFATSPACFAVLGWAEALVGHLAEAERHLSRGVLLAGRQGDNYLHPVLLAGLGYTYQELGRFVEAERAILEAAAAQHELVDDSEPALIIGLQARNVATTRRLHRTVGDADDYEAMCALWPRDSRWTRIAVLALADAALLIQDFELSASLVLRAGGGVELRDLPPSLRPRCYQAVTAASVHASAAADRWAEYAAESAAASLPQEHAFVITARGHLDRSRGDVRAAARRYEEAAELFSIAKMPGAQARALLEAARSATEAGDTAAATALLVLTKQLARECASAGVYEAAEEVARTLGRLDPELLDPTPAFAELTGREREIARLIATTGMRTREIAEQLGVSPRTVDAHLARIYRKLNISSRAALAALSAGKFPLSTSPL